VRSLLTELEGAAQLLRARLLADQHSMHSMALGMGAAQPAAGSAAHFAMHQQLQRPGTLPGSPGALQAPPASPAMFHVEAQAAGGFYNAEHQQQHVGAVGAPPLYPSRLAFQSQAPQPLHLSPEPSGALCSPGLSSQFTLSPTVVTGGVKAAPVTAVTAAGVSPGALSTSTATSFRSPGGAAHALSSPAAAAIAASRDAMLGRVDTLRASLSQLGGCVAVTVTAGRACDHACMHA
jgi:hypothetical protein